MSARAVALLRSAQNKLTAHSEIFVRVTFGVFMGGLVVLLILLYADVPILGLFMPCRLWRTGSPFRSGGRNLLFTIEFCPAHFRHNVTTL